MKHDLRYFLEKSDSFLGITHDLATGPNTRNSVFSQVLECVFRKDYFTLQTIYFLGKKIEEDYQCGAVFSGSILDLSRRVLEDWIYMQYIKVNGPERYSKQFWDYKAVEDKRAFCFAEKYGNPDKKIKEKVNHKYEKIKKKLKIRNNWSGQPFESIIDDLVEKKEINEIEKDVLLKSYVWCCQANHTSPSDISCYINQSELDAYSVDMLSIPFQISLISLINVANLFLGERSSSEELKTKLENFKKNFLN
jgi:hypothetical protein